MGPLIDFLDFLHGNALVGFLPLLLLAAALLHPSVRDRLAARTIWCSLGATALAGTSNLFGRWFSLGYALHHEHADRLTPFQASVAQFGESNSYRFGAIRVGAALASLILGILAVTKPKGRLVGVASIVCSALALANTDRYH